LAYDSEGDHHHYGPLSYDADDEWESSGDAEDGENDFYTTNDNLLSDRHTNTNPPATASLPFTPSDSTGPRPSSPLYHNHLLPPSASDSSLLSSLRAWFDMPSPSDPDFHLSDTDVDIPSTLEGIYTSSPSLSSSWLLEEAAAQGEEQQQQQQTGDQADDEDELSSSEDGDDDDDGMADFWLNTFMTTPAGIAFVAHQVDQELDDLPAEEFDALMGLITDGEVDDESSGFSSSERWEEDEDDDMRKLWALQF
jgi:hypothetical protein